MLHENERIDQLYAEDIQIIQSSQVFSFSLDAVLLANFARLPKNGQIVDLCAGNGAVGLFLSKRTNAQIDAIELQPRLADMARRSVALNHLEQQITVHTLDLKDSLSVVRHDSCDVVVCNPPYFKGLPTNKKNPNEYLAIARHEIHTTLEEVIATAGRLLKTTGRLALVHRPDRFLEIINIMQACKIAPKRVQFIYPKAGKEANILLVEGIKQGKLDGFKIAPPLFTYDEEGNYTAEIREILYGK
ncbi:methyltransferase [Enterococcus sp. 10A9_DIV0425]|uniref:Methyltransferase n=1 Tax=Candidatus Enterococcus wittei TaxID=1987383 RepID=A0A242JYZ3_9ENTE|nr:tRNA1(Val) (adenine(37)-N6)-methyltransferase [Enterococcus sp. 10A9_DIV0425]OTP10452.1 methyltransferase [Enterococcus sp. 10A9_DIV0425]THE14595.1 tRNA1(Val) (adenine(37)-N6)-methyltransferase [Enterococcus hirae]